LHAIGGLNFLFAGRGKMNKADLINEIENVLGTREAAENAVDCFVTTITKVMKKRQPISLAGFGTFKVDDRKARKGRNPRTGESIEIAARAVPKFVPAKALKDAVDGEI
jgi:DNA-binding protein HU-beta